MVFVVFRNFKGYRFYCWIEEIEFLFYNLGSNYLSNLYIFMLRIYRYYCVIEIFDFNFSIGVFILEGKVESVELLVMF